MEYDRVTTTGRAVRGSGGIPALEALRGLAACAVVVYHVARHLDKAYGAPSLISAVQFGHAGVDVFFVLSGFLILLAHGDDVGRPDRAWRYAVRRLTRVFPPYWIALALTILLATLGHASLPSLQRLAMSAFLVPATAAPLLDIAWTLQFEVVFYALFGLLIVNRRAGVTAFTVWIAASLVQSMSGVRLPIAPQLADPYVLEFGLGMSAAWLTRRGAVRKPALIGVLGALAFGVAAIAEGRGALDGQAWTARLAYGLPAAALVLAVARPGFAVPALSRALGRASYSIYLFQFVWIGIAWQVLGRVGHAKLGVEFLVLCVAGIVGGLVTSALVEQPLLALARGPALRPLPSSGVG